MGVLWVRVMKTSPLAPAPFLFITQVGPPGREGKIIEIFSWIFLNFLWELPRGGVKIIQNLKLFLNFLVFQNKFELPHIRPPRWEGKIIENCSWVFWTFLVFQNKLELPHKRPPGMEGKNNWKCFLNFLKQVYFFLLIEK